ncbi:hypothetical protein [Cohnella fermenti]|uniref:Uncharacterized protein n=1 Tax=Cohnella fermenti TaxID=2565925 RepID=A0A4S4BH77_9BACL|nr:hypothetical protein [Cohnella fermenti]THF73269.1 hypothetical protein E6C55_30065 [Cohnella fermenti]
MAGSDNLDLILKKIEAIENEQQRNGGHMQQLLQIVGATNAKVVDSRNEVVNDIAEIGLRLSQTNEKLDELVVHVEALLKNQLNVMEIQQDQQKILERLSIRSISQEADIADLRRIK